MPPSTRLWLISKSFLEAGDLTHDSIQGDKPRDLGFPCLFCYARSIELALKVVLIINDVPAKTILKHGHHLARLADEVMKFIPLSDLNIEAADLKFIQSFSDDYANKWFEYPETLWRKKPPLQKLRVLAHKILDAAKEHDQKSRSSKS